MISQKPKTVPDTTTPKKRSVLGLLFNPRLGDSISPLRESTHMFVQLVAAVFAIYGLFPKDHPALRDQSLPLSFAQVIRTGWSRIEFTRAGAPRAMMFFAVLGIIVVSTIAVFLFILSMFVGQAHAQTSVFTAPAPATDVAYNWIEYLFNNGGYPSATFSASDGTTSNMNDPFAGSINLQNALVTALAVYSGAILIVAAMVLFYHLTAMVVETAHDGVPMGKRANQIWAPIRLVVAVGLLVPINSGLNSGQYIVIKMAEMGSGLASNVWNGFLTTVSRYDSKPVIPNAPIQQNIAVDLVLMNACKDAWNKRIDEVSGAGVDLSASKIDGPINGATQSNIVLGNVPGTKYSYSSTALSDVDLCGWYFIPNGGGNQLIADADIAQQKAINDAMPAIEDAAQEILPLIPANGNAAAAAAATQPKFDGKFSAAVKAYNNALNARMKALTNQNTPEVEDAANSIKPYGWVMAGTFLNSIDRIQPGVSSAVIGSTPKTEPPQSEVSDSERPGSGSVLSLSNDMAWLRRHVDLSSNMGGNSFSMGDGAWNMRKLVAGDMAAFDDYAYSSLTNSGNAVPNATAQCSAMVGLANLSGGKGGWAAEKLFSVINLLATADGVWSDGTANQCNGTQQFSLGIQFSGADPLTQIAYLGHANLETSFDLLGIALGGGILGMIPVVGKGFSMIASISSFFALIFWICGFTLAFLVPLMPFMRFTFAVLSWMAGVVEGVIAIPLVALAHLNPEGAGLPGQAKNAYFFIFNLLLRPVLIVFGLIGGFILFFIAISFLNYGYGIAVAGAGATSYGYVAMTKIIYSALYVVIVYICANHAFQLIDSLPHQALSWMGASGQHMHKMGDADKVENLGAVVSGFAGKETMGKISGAAISYGKGVAQSREQNAKAAKSGAIQDAKDDNRARAVIRGDETLL